MRLQDDLPYGFSGAGTCFCSEALPKFEAVDEAAMKSFQCSVSNVSDSCRRTAEPWLKCRYLIVHR